MIYQYKRSTNEKERQNIANELISTFLENESILETNLEGNVIKRVKEKKNKEIFLDDLFDEVEEGVLTNLMDTFIRFKATKQYIELKMKM